MFICQEYANSSLVMATQSLHLSLTFPCILALRALSWTLVLDYHLINMVDGYNNKLY